MRILSIETSCDDTAVTIFEARGGIRDAVFKILANNSNSQIKIHIPYGGVFPALAKREHQRNLPLLLEKTLKEAKLGQSRIQIFSNDKAVNVRGERKNLSPAKLIDLIAVTSGPGLEPALWTGIVFAKELAEKWSVPLIPANHMEGHIFSVFGKGKGKFKVKKLKLPALALLVSGGHTQLVLMKKWMRYEIIGETVDDAVGEAFDKVARMLGLPYAGGPGISKLAELQRNMLLKRTDIFLLKNSSCSPRRAPKSFQKHISSAQSSEITLPRPMLHSKNFNFSFSGLKTAVLYLIRDIGKLNEKIKTQIALEFENAAVDCLVYKSAKAVEKYKIKTLIVAGGVAANSHLRNEMRKVAGKKIKLLFPPKELTADNSLMIGIVGYLNYIKNKKRVPQPDSIKATGNLSL